MGFAETETREALEDLPNLLDDQWAVTAFSCLGSKELFDAVGCSWVFERASELVGLG